MVSKYVPSKFNPLPLSDFGGTLNEAGLVS